MKENKSIFSKQNLKISLNCNEVDKFSDAKKMHPDFSVDLQFDLIEKDKF